jgi:hypothetical protein
MSSAAIPTTADATTDTKTYLLRDVDAEVWRAASARAKADGVPMRTALVYLLTAYAEGSVTLGVRGPLRPRRVVR